MSGRTSMRRIRIAPIAIPSRKKGASSGSFFVETRSVVHPSPGWHGRHGRLLLGLLGDHRPLLNGDTAAACTLRLQSPHHARSPRGLSRGGRRTVCRAFRDATGIDFVLGAPIAPSAKRAPLTKISFLNAPHYSNNSSVVAMSFPAHLVSLWRH